MNGFTFDPFNVEEMANAMLKISAFQDVRLSAFGDASRAILAHWGPEKFASSLKAAADKALEIGPKHAGIADRLLLQSLLAR